MLEEQEQLRNEERSGFVAFGDPKWKQPLQRQLNKVSHVDVTSATGSWPCVRNPSVSKTTPYRCLFELSAELFFVYFPQSFSLHLGADLPLPCPARPVQLAENSEQAVDKPKTGSRPFDEVPFAEFAERIGSAVAPVYHDFKMMQQDESRRAKNQAKTAEPWEPPVPHFLPFTRM